MHSVKRKWIEALRSGKYKQGVGQLRCDDAYCCLGVLCEVSGLGEWEGDYFRYKGIVDPFGLSTPLRKQLGITLMQQKQLIGMNDEGGASFEDIASWIDENLPNE